MPKRTLNGINIVPVPQPLQCEAAPHSMEALVPFKTRPLFQPSQDGHDPGNSQRKTFIRKEEKIIRSYILNAGRVSAQHFPAFISAVNKAKFSAFAAFDRNPPGVQVNIPKAQIAEFLPPQTGVYEQIDHRYIPLRKLTGFCRVDQRVHLVHCKTRNRNRPPCCAFDLFNRIPKVR